MLIAATKPIKITTMPISLRRMNWSKGNLTTCIDLKTVNFAICKFGYAKKTPFTYNISSIATNYKVNYTLVTDIYL